MGASLEDRLVKNKELQLETITLGSHLKRMEEKLCAYDEYAVVRLGQGGATQELRKCFAAEPWLLTPNQRYALANHKGNESSAGSKTVQTTKKGSALDFLMRK
jgi:hypothetical protein